jgi:hypothetical protein
LTLFVEDFDRIDAPPPPPQDPGGVDAAALLEAEYARGLADGAARARAECDGGAALLVERCIAEFRRADETIAAMADATAERLVRLMFEALGTMVPSICATCGPAEIAGLTQVLLPRLRNEPRIRVRLNPHDAPALQAQLDLLEDELPERISVTQTDAVARGDIRVSWQDGAMLRDTAAIWREVADWLRLFGFLDQPPRERAPLPMLWSSRPDAEQVVEHAR